MILALLERFVNFLTCVDVPETPSLRGGGGELGARARYVCRVPDPIPVPGQPSTSTRPSIGVTTERKLRQEPGAKTRCLSSRLSEMENG